MFDVSKYVNERLGIDVPCGNMSITCRLTKKTHKDYPPIIWHARHGSRGVSSSAGDLDNIRRNEARRVKRLLRFKRMDSIIMSYAHIHKVRICPPVDQMGIIWNGANAISQTYPKVMMGPNGEIEENSRWYFSTGAFFGAQLENIDTYADMYDYDPLQLGCAKVMVEDNRVVAVEPVIVGN
jgi:hypothetical protein